MKHKCMSENAIPHCISLPVRIYPDLYFAIRVYTNNKIGRKRKKKEVTKQSQQSLRNR